MNWILEAGDSDHPVCKGDEYVGPGNKDTWYQFIISVSLGISAFLSFCVSQVQTIIYLYAPAT